MNERTRKIIESENDPQILKALLLQAADFIQNQKALIEKLEAEKARKEQQSFLIEEKIKLLNRQMYGKSKEDRIEASDRPRDKSQSDALLFSQAVFPSDELRFEDGKKIKDRWENLEKREIEHDISDQDLEDESNLRGLENPSNDQWEVFREKESAKIIGRIKDLLLQEYPRSRESSQKRKAILYVQKRWDGFTKFLTDTRIPLSNNEAERTIRHAAMGRKNYYGSGNQSGAETAATLFTIIESAKKNDIDPRTYLLGTLTELAAGREPLTPLALAKKVRQ